MNHSLAHLPQRKQKQLEIIVKIIRAAVVAAFQLHQATEHYFKCAILVVTAYWPKEHNVKYLAKLAAGLEPQLRDIFPLKPRREKRRRELLKEAYVKARYSLEWTISREDLEVLAQRIAVLRDRTQAVCEAYIDSLSESAPEPSL